MRTGLKLILSEDSTISIVVLMTAVSLLLWWNSPIYPDEVAYRIARLRAIPDGGLIRGLFATCGPSESLSAVWLYPAAWAFSWIDLHVGASNLRILPIASILFATLSVASYAKSFEKTYLAFGLFIGLLGVAGSALILARFEYVVTLNIATCIVTLQVAKARSLNSIASITLIVTLLSLSSASVYTHPQGLLFLPLSMFAIVEVWTALEKQSNKRTVLAKLALACAIIFALLIVWSAIAGMNYCKDSPQMQAALSNMTLQSVPTNIGDFVNFITEKFAKYSDSLLYKDEYQVNYLPGVVDSSNKVQLTFVNFILRIYVLSSFIFVLIGVIYGSAIVAYDCYMKGFINALNRFQSLIGAILISMPAFVLLIYDSQQNFYRSIFINFIISIALVLLMTQVAPRNKEEQLKKIGVMAIFVVPLLVTFYVNYKTFYYRLSEWSAIYSLPRKRLTDDVARQVTDVAMQCGIDPTQGGLVVDGLTYDAVKKYENLTLIWYVEYQSMVTGLTIEDIINRSDTHNVIASCDAMERSRVGWPVQKKNSMVCCFRYDKQ